MTDVNFDEFQAIRRRKAQDDEEDEDQKEEPATTPKAEEDEEPDGLAERAGAFAEHPAAERAGAFAEHPARTLQRWSVCVGPQYTPGRDRINFQLSQAKSNTCGCNAGTLDWNVV